MERDTIYSIPQTLVGDFAFDDTVADVFPDMIRRSVPGYASILSMIQQFAERFVQHETAVYDLGCSLGAATLLIRERAPVDCTIHAIDSSPAMVKRLKQKIEDQNRRVQLVGAPRCKIKIHQADICEFPYEKTSFVILNLTLQFIPREKRPELLQRIFDALTPGGALLLSEKICFSDARQQRLMTEMHHDFKRAHGYSDLEIAQKRSSLEKCLLPETLEEHVSRLRGVGFKCVSPWLQCFNFASILATKCNEQ